MSVVAKELIKEALEKHEDLLLFEMAIKRKRNQRKRFYMTRPRNKNFQIEYVVPLPCPRFFIRPLSTSLLRRVLSPGFVMSVFSKM